MIDPARHGIKRIGIDLESSLHMPGDSSRAPGLYLESMMSKGDSYRSVDRKAWDENYEKIFGPKDTTAVKPAPFQASYCPDCGQRWNGGTCCTKCGQLTEAENP